MIFKCDRYLHILRIVLAGELTCGRRTYLSWSSDETPSLTNLFLCKRYSAHTISISRHYIQSLPYRNASHLLTLVAAIFLRTSYAVFAKLQFRKMCYASCWYPILCLNKARPTEPAHKDVLYFLVSWNSVKCHRYPINKTTWKSRTDPH